MCIYVCTIIGASFITGNEVFTFFARYGNIAYWFVALSFVLFVLFSLIIFAKCRKANIYNLLDIFNFKNKPKNKIIIIMKIFTYATYFMFSVVMLAGLRELFGIVFTFVSVFICFILIKKDIGAIVKLNTLLFPLVIVYLISLAFLSRSGQDVSSGVTINAFSIYNIFTYVSLNVILVFGSMLKITKDMSDKQVYISVLLSGLVFSLLIVSQILILSHAHITNFSMPLLDIASENKLVYIFTLVVTFLAMISSYLSSTYSLYAKIKVKQDGDFYLVLIVIAMLIASFLGFAKIVQLSYILLGFMSLILVFYICFTRFIKCN